MKQIEDLFKPQKREKPNWDEIPTLNEVEESHKQNLIKYFDEAFALEKVPADKYDIFNYICIKAVYFQVLDSIDTLSAEEQIDVLKKIDVKELLHILNGVLSTLTVYQALFPNIGDWEAELINLAAGVYKSHFLNKIKIY